VVGAAGTLGSETRAEQGRDDSDAPPGSGTRLSGAAPILLVYTIETMAVVTLLIVRHFGIVANEPWWVYASVIVGSSLVSRRLDRWSYAPRGSWRLHARVCFHALTVFAVIYLTGWGPALGLCFVYAALVDIQQSGPASWRAVLGWSLVCWGLGQSLVFEGWMPSFLSHSAAQSLGFLGAIAFSIVIIMAGSIGEAKQRADELLASARDEALRREAHHRAVVDHAAEGILTVSADGSILSFNAAAEKMFDWTAQEIVGQPAARIVPAALDHHLANYLVTCQQNPADAQRHGLEVEGVRRDGTHFPMSLSTSAITSKDGPVVISGIVRDLSENKRFEAQLAFQALHDPLTGLPNRIMLADRLNQTLARVRRHHRMCGVLYVDLDRFKAVNDTLGHGVGDQLLMEAAARIQRTVRETDTVARLGGDEFVVLCEDVEGLHHATDMAQRLITAFQSPFHLGDDDAHVGASIGIAYSVGGTETSDKMLANADIAMYRAKKNGRACYELFDEEMQHWISTTVKREAALRHAVPRNELVLYTQPIVAADSGAIRGFEALVRWDRPGFGRVLPDSFIPTAEETGLILDIGGWVLDESCRHAARWAQRWPNRDLRVAVNVSGRQLMAGNFVDVVSDVLDRTSLDPALLTLELTESTLIDDAITVAPLLHELRSLGVNLALDDFGTGYSSLTYLRTFPFNVIKIDRSFIRNVGTEQDDTAIAAAVIGLADDLGLVVIAEGVETAEQLAALRQLECHYVQGYLFAVPHPIDEAATVLENPGLALAGLPDGTTVVGPSAQ
jgi:diguanylate cyclase (GGDEF)-like protein/PAS domain S-box-containing protein